MKPHFDFLLNHLLYPVAFQQCFVLLTVSSPQAFPAHQVLYAHHAIQNRFGPWRASRHIYIHRHYLVYALQYAVRIKHPSAGSTGANGYHPAGLSHL